MSRNATELGLQFRKQFGYTGKITRQDMGKQLWNEWCKLASKKRTSSTEYKKLLAERRAERRRNKYLKLKQNKENGSYLSKYCIDDITHIENYFKAKADGFKGWQCHHRLETHTSDGLLREVYLTASELIYLNMYYNRPAEELILMKTDEHRRLHLCGKPGQRRIIK